MEPRSDDRLAFSATLTETLSLLFLYFLFEQVKEMDKRQDRKCQFGLSPFHPCLVSCPISSLPVFTFTWMGVLHPPRRRPRPPHPVLHRPPRHPLPHPPLTSPLRQLQATAQIPPQPRPPQPRLLPPPPLPPPRQPPPPPQQQLALILAAAVEAGRVLEGEVDRAAGEAAMAAQVGDLARTRHRPQSRPLPRRPRLSPCRGRPCPMAACPASLSQSLSQPVVMAKSSLGRRISQAQQPSQSACLVGSSSIDQILKLHCRSPSSRDHTATIVGATVGGTAALVLAFFAFIFYARHRRAERHRAFDKDIFNPDHTTRGPNFDLGGGGPMSPDAMPVPYTYQPPDEQMRQAQGTFFHHPDPALLGAAGLGAGAAATTAAIAYNHNQDNSGDQSSVGRSPSSSSRNSSGAPLMNVAAGGAPGGRVSPPTSSASAGSLPASALFAGAGAAAGVGAVTSGRAAKEREAFERTRARERASLTGPAPSAYPFGMHVANSPPSVYSHAHSMSGASNNGRAFTIANGSDDLPNPYDGVAEEGDRSMSPTRSVSQSGHTRSGSMDEIGMVHSNMGTMSSRRSRVVVHQDAGRVRMPMDDDDEMEGSEIPPTYDSIPHEQTPDASPITPSSPTAAVHPPPPPEPALTHHSRPSELSLNGRERLVAPGTISAPGTP